MNKLAEPYKMFETIIGIDNCWHDGWITNCISNIFANCRPNFAFFKSGSRRKTAEWQ